MVLRIKKVVKLVLIVISDINNRKIGTYFIKHPQKVVK